MPIPDPVIYQLKVVLQGISPMIRRRLLIRGDTTIADLHYILQIAMGWSDDHLHQFRIHGKRYGIARMGGILFSDDPHAVRLKDLGLRINERFVYEYDFTDNWQHLIRVEAILAPEPHRHYPLCIDGRRACPPEDGGSQDHQEGLEALHYWMHIDRFDRKGTNRRLYDYARGEDVFMWA